VIGSTGNIGTSVLEGLVQAKVPVRVLVRDPDKVKKYPNVEVIKGDLLDVATLPPAFKDVKKSIPCDTICRRSRNTRH